jgi:hypothetical protein
MIENKGGQDDELGIVWADSFVDSHFCTLKDFYQMHA